MIPEENLLRAPLFRDPGQWIRRCGTAALGIRLYEATRKKGRVAQVPVLSVLSKI